MKKYGIIIFIVSIILLIPSVAYAGHEGSTWTWNEGYGPEEIKECQFTANIEKSWVFFQERSWVSGFVVNCDPEYGWQYVTSNDESFYEKDRIFVRILDINGDLVESGNHLKDNSARYDDIETSPYVMSYVVNRSGEYKDISGKDAITVQPNQYFFYLPQISSLDFEHQGIYQIELTYDEHVRTIWFATLSPDMSWQQDPCINYEEKLILLDNKLKSLDLGLDRLEELGLYDKIQETIDLMDETDKEIKLLKECQV